MMPDREKVIKGLEILMNGCAKIDCDDCYFYISTKPTRCGLREEQIQEDAIALLKEQEAKQAIKQIYHVMMNQDYENPVEVTRYDWLCPTCKSLLCRDIDVIDDNYHFCKVCGQAVKWDE